MYTLTVYSIIIVKRIGVKGCETVCSIRMPEIFLVGSKRKAGGISR